MPHSVLKKKSNSIAFHFVREGSAKDEWRTTYVNTDENPVNMMTKPLPSGGKRIKFNHMLLRHPYNTMVCWWSESTVAPEPLRFKIYILNTDVDVGLVPNHEFSESMIGFMCVLSMVLMNVSHEK